MSHDVLKLAHIVKAILKRMHRGFGHHECCGSHGVTNEVELLLPGVGEHVVQHRRQVVPFKDLRYIYLIKWQDVFKGFISEEPESHYI